MHRMRLSHKRAFKGIFLTSLLLGLGGCAISGVIVDRSGFQTRVKGMKLVESPVFKVYHGGATTEVPLKMIYSLNLDPAEQMHLDNELYYGAELKLKDGGEVKPAVRNNDGAGLYVSIQNTITGKFEKNKFRIPLHNASLIEIDK